jgi:DNA-binding transcriptional ArsR family regulator
MLSIRQQNVAVTTGDDGDRLSETKVHFVLSNERRRAVLSQLQAADEPLSTRALSELVAGVEAGVTPPPRDVRQSVYVSLQQTHLPKLEGLGIITIREDGGVVLTEQATVVMNSLNRDSEAERPWGAYYLGLATVGLGVQLAGFADVPVLGDLAFTGVTVVLLICAVSAAYHLSQQESSLLGQLTG